LKESSTNGLQKNSLLWGLEKPQKQQKPGNNTSPFFAHQWYYGPFEPPKSLIGGVLRGDFPFKNDYDFKRFKK